MTQRTRCGPIQSSGFHEAKGGGKCDQDVKGRVHSVPGRELLHADEGDAQRGAPAGPYGSGRGAQLHSTRENIQQIQTFYQGGKEADKAAETGGAAEEEAKAEEEL